jgi:hypothetical protein
MKTETKGFRSRGIMTIQEKAALIAEFKPVTIQDDLMFGTVMEDPKYCKPFLETILGSRSGR